MSEIERLRFDVRELTRSRDGWEERCERLEAEVEKLLQELKKHRERIQGWADDVNERSGV